MTVLPKAVYRFSAVPIKLSVAFYTDLEQMQYLYGDKKSQSNLEKEDWIRRNQPSRYQTILQATVINIICNQHKNRTIDQWNKRESPDINTYTCGHLIFEKTEKVHDGEKTVSSTSGAGKTGQLHVKYEIRTLSSIIHKNKLKVD